MRYWVYMNGEVPGSYTPAELAALPGFSMASLVCPAEGEILEKNWRRAGEFDDVSRVFGDRDVKMPPPLPIRSEGALAGMPSLAPADPAVDAPAPGPAASAPPGPTFASSAPAFASPSPAPTPRTSGLPNSGPDINALLDSASARLFTHVSAIMKELENRREERTLLHTTQRQLTDHKDQLLQALDKISGLETRAARIPELEEAAHRDQMQIQKLEATLKTREQAVSDLRIGLEKTRTELEGVKRKLGETANDLSIRNRLVDKLSRDLTEKEVSLSKALGVIRRLEEDLHRLVPVDSAAPQSDHREDAPRLDPVMPEVAVMPQPIPEPVAAPPAPLEPMTAAAPPLPELAEPSADEALPAVAAEPLAAAVVKEAPEVTPMAAAPLSGKELKENDDDEAAPKERPAAQSALVNRFRKFISSKYDH